MQPLKKMERAEVEQHLREAAAALEELVPELADFLGELADHEARTDRVLTFHLPQTLDLVAKVTMAVAKEFPDGTLDGRGPDESVLITAPRKGAAASGQG